MEHKENIEMEKVQTQHQKVLDAVSEIQERGLTAAERLKKLQAQFGEIVLKAAMGEMAVDEPSKMRREMQELREAIEDAESVMEPARIATSRFSGESQKISRRIGYRREYEVLKVKISEAGAATWADTTTLRDYCLMLNGSHDAADVFLSQIKPAAA